MSEARDRARRVATEGDVVMRVPAVCALLGLLTLPFAGRAADAPVDVDGRVAAHLASLRPQFDPRVNDTLDRIDGLARRLLAARAYLRVRGSLDERWSWSQAEIERYAGSPLQRALDAEIGRVRVAFEAQNPGYTLWVNPEVRSLELQIERWNENVSVAAAADSLLTGVREAVSRADAPAVGSPAAREWFAGLLRSAAPRPMPTLAAPGLSRHGRMQAVDFQVRQGDRTVAAPSADDIATVWDGGGWCERLVRAVRTASDRFEGPLVTPNEPWHYEYRAVVSGEWAVASGR